MLGTLVKRFGSVDAGVRAAEAIAVRLLVDEHDSSQEWATGYIAEARGICHMGDCEQARPWCVGPVTCSACVYDELMGRAWQELGITAPAAPPAFAPPA